MNQRMKKVKLLTQTQRQDAYGKFSASATAETEIEMAISTLTGSKQNSNNTLIVNSTHLGLSIFRNISTSNQIKDGSDIYTIDYVNATRRYTMVYLNLVRGDAEQN
jgi:hypothetical protein